jgi:hypothetical protein
MPDTINASFLFLMHCFKKIHKEIRNIIQMCVKQ